MLSQRSLRQHGDEGIARRRGNAASLLAVTQDHLFAYFVLEGTRFDAVGLPAESTAEIAFYRDLLIDVAARLWRSANPDQECVPRGFCDGFDLRLAEVRSGSARPQLVLPAPNVAGRSGEREQWYDFYKQARDLVTRTVNTVDREGVLPRRFPVASVGRLRRLGSTLRDSEKITIGPPRWERPRATVGQRFRDALWDVASLGTAPSVP